MDSKMLAGLNMVSSLLGLLGLLLLLSCKLFRCRVRT
jgi:hypothetical protein